MSAVFATTPEVRAVEVAQVEANAARYAEQVAAEMDRLDAQLAVDTRMYLAQIAYYDPESATHGSDVQRDIDRGNHLARVKRDLTRCVTRLTRAGVR